MKEYGVKENIMKEDKRRINVKQLLVSFVLLLAAFSLCGFSTKEEQRVYDEDRLYSDEEAASLEQLCADVSEEISTDLVIVTTDSYEGKTATEYADDFYDSHDFGYGEEKDGFVLVINMSERELAVSNAGTAPKYFTDEMIDEMIGSIGGYLADQDYMGAAQWYVSYVQEHMWKVDYTKSGTVRTLSTIWCQLLIALVAAVVVLIVLYSGRRTHMGVGSHTYLKGNTHQVRQKQDLYVRTHTTKQKIETSSGNGGGSTHTSSSGSSHGGGSGHF